MKRGIIQSRGLGDIIIALPIARFYHNQGEEIVWPVCEEFVGSLQASVPWVTWVGVTTDPQGAFFVESVLRVFKYHDVDPQEALYLYHYLNTQPQMTDPELFNILKFDQYKYQTAGVPFLHKWRLQECITRDLAREQALGATLGVKQGERYAVVHLQGSSFRAEVDTSWIDPAVRLIDIDAHKTDSIWDWLTVLEGAELVLCVDSVFANMIDQMDLQGPERYWIRRSPWDLTPVMGGLWTIVPTRLPITEPKRIDPAVEARALIARVEAARRQQAQPQPQPASSQYAGSAPGAGNVISHVPFQAQGQIPTNFMHAVKNQGGASTNVGAGRPAGANAAQDLYKSLGVKF